MGHRITFDHYSWMVLHRPDAECRAWLADQYENPSAPRPHTRFKIRKFKCARCGRDGYGTQHNARYCGRECMLIAQREWQRECRRLAAEARFAERDARRILSERSEIGLVDGVRSVDAPA